jgi:predicted RNase H-like HicB family nuclease
MILSGNSPNFLLIKCKEEALTMKKTERYFYPAIFTYENGKEIAVVFPDLDCATSGNDDDTAFLSARELLGSILYGLEEDGKEVPEPTSLSQIEAQKNERVVLIDVYMPSIRMAQVNRSVNRTVTLPAWLNAKALEHEINFSQVLQEALKMHLNIK